MRRGLPPHKCSYKRLGLHNHTYHVFKCQFCRMIWYIDRPALNGLLSGKFALDTDIPNRRYTLVVRR